VGKGVNIACAHHADSTVTHNARRVRLVALRAVDELFSLMKPAEQPMRHEADFCANP